MNKPVERPRYRVLINARREDIWIDVEQVDIAAGLLFIGDDRPIVAVLVMIIFDRCEDRIIFPSSTKAGTKPGRFIFARLSDYVARSKTVAGASGGGVVGTGDAGSVVGTDGSRAAGPLLNQPANTALQRN